jgi:NAD(P)-dependent dehydrogenase (short-subunit alcohol dehydrogenase family)
MISLSLADAVAVVTGAASGIGRATASVLARADATVALVDRDREGLAETSSQITGAGGRCRSFYFDLIEWDKIPALVTHILAECGHIDILVNSAGISDGGRRLFDIEPDLWERVYTINLRSPFVLMQEVGRHMVARGRGGKIVNISSSSAFRADRFTAPVYASAKAALTHLTRVVAAELGPYDINVNAVVPGVTETPMTKGSPPEIVREGPLANHLQRVSQPEDVANAVLFLCVPESRQVTAQAIHTSAGNIIR